MAELKQYKTFEQFYGFYLSQHSNRTNRRLHIIGTLLSLTILIFSLMTSSMVNLIYIPLVGYGLAWVGHFFFEKNKPATFKYPLMSFMGDLKMFKETITGQRSF